MPATDRITTGTGRARRRPPRSPAVTLAATISAAAVLLSACSSGNTFSPTKAAGTPSHAQQGQSAGIPTPQPFRLDNVFVVTGADDGRTLKLHVGDTLLVRLAGSHVIGAVLYQQPQTADWRVLVPIPDPQCPDVAAVEQMLQMSGASAADAQSLAAAVSCAHQLFASGEAFAAFRAVTIGTARITAQALDHVHPPFEVSFQVVGETAP
jgi:hypothetical protein